HKAMVPKLFLVHGPLKSYIPWTLENYYISSGPLRTILSPVDPKSYIKYKIAFKSCGVLENYFIYCEFFERYYTSRGPLDSYFIYRESYIP
ncbi:hypothetical protein Ahia01_000001400, partial [Argonauta hians]